MGWISRIISPHKGSRETGLLVRCSCGRAMWMGNRASKKVKLHHTGHRMVALEHGTFWEFCKLKLGLLNCRTLGECLKDWGTL